MLNNIKINQTTKEIILNINVVADLQDVLDELAQKLPKLKEFYQESTLPIKITGKLFTETEMEIIKMAIGNELDVEIRFDNASDLLGLHAIKKTFESQTEISETKFVQNSIRSGQREEYSGSIVVCGDVNAGAEIVAGGNIMVLGALRGVAHAGANGNTKAIISANYIDVTQVRISNMVTEISERIEKCPICKVEGNEIIVV